MSQIITFKMSSSNREESIPARSQTAANWNQTRLRKSQPRARSPLVACWICSGHCSTHTHTHTHTHSNLLPSYPCGHRPTYGTSATVPGVIHHRARPCMCVCTCDSVKLLLWHIEARPLLQQVTPIKRGGDTDTERGGEREGKRKEGDWK